MSKTSSIRFQLTELEANEHSRSQFVTLNKDGESIKRGKNIKYLPYVFTEPGVAMLSAVLHSDLALAANVRIIENYQTT